MQQTDYTELMSNKTDEQLQVYLNSSSRYVPEAVNAAIAELERRGTTLPVEEKEKVIAASVEKTIPSDFTPSYVKQRKYHTTDENAPLLYSKRAVWGFSAFGSVMFGTILMAINIRKNNLRGFYVVLITGIALYAVGAAVLLLLPQIRSLAFVINILLSMVLVGPLWNKYIGTETMYRPRKIWVPLVIAVIFFVVIVAIAIRSMP